MKSRETTATSLKNASPKSKICRGTDGQANESGVEVWLLDNNIPLKLAPLLESLSVRCDTAKN